MPSPLRSFFIGALEQQNQQRKENSALMKELFLAKQKAQMANLDAGEILDQIQLKNIISQINRMSEQQSGQPGSQWQQQFPGTPGLQPSFLRPPLQGQVQFPQQGQPQVQQTGQPQRQLYFQQQPQGRQGIPGQQSQQSRIPLHLQQSFAQSGQQVSQDVSGLERPEINEDLPPPTITRFEKDPKFGGLIEVTKENPDYKTALDVQKSWQTQILKDRKTAMENFSTVAALLQNTVAVWKASAAEKQLVPAGLAARGVGGAAKLLDLPGFSQTKAYEGQVIETSMALSKIITGGSRIIKSVINQLANTLPKDNGRYDDMKALISQSFRNSFSRALGRPLKANEMKFVDRKLRTILAAPAAVSPTADGPAGQRIAVPYINATKTLQVNGKNYEIPIHQVLEFINDPQFKNSEIFDVTDQEGF